MKKFLFALFIAFISITSVNASTNIYDRVGNNLGVNKAIPLTPSVREEVLKTPLVNAAEKIYDFADILSYDEEINLYSVIRKYVDETNMEMVVLTTDLNKTDYGIEDYAANFYDYNDFGIDFEHYSGILLIINTNYNNRFYNIYTFGNAMIYYNDYRLENTLDAMYDDMVNNSFNGAIHTFINMCNDYYLKGIPDENIGAYIDDLGDIVYPFKAPYALAFIISSIVTLIFVSILVNKNKMVKKATLASEYLDSGSVKLDVCNDEFLGSHTKRVRVSRSGSSYSSSYGGRSSSSRGSSGRSHGGGRGRHF